MIDVSDALPAHLRHDGYRADWNMTDCVVTIWNARQPITDEFAATADEARSWVTEIVTYGYTAMCSECRADIAAYLGDEHPKYCSVTCADIGEFDPDRYDTSDDGDYEDIYGAI